MKKSVFFLIAAVLITAPVYGAAVTIDVNSDRIPISEYIYGVNIYGDSTQPGTYPYLDSSINWGSRRLGGNRATGYNWENNASNAGADYGPNQSDSWWCTVYGTTNCSTPGALVTRFVNDCNTRGWEPLVTAQMAGFVAADSLGTNVTTTAVSGLTTDRWKTVQYAKGSAFSLTPNTSDEYVYMDEFVNWMVNQFGSAATANGVKMISMDNEPTLWDSTHPLIYPNNVTYLDLKNRTIALAQAIKNVDPNVLLFGAVDYGWSAFMNLNSAPDAATEGAGYTWFVDYYLDKLEAASASYGNRLLDVLDIHWYPEDNGNNCRIVYTEYDGDCSNPTDYDLNSVARMQAPRCLWDSTYTEDSWIPSPIRLIPRLQDSINTYYPGTKIAITEYDFGGGTHYSAGIAQADALGVFTEYGVFAAYLWDITPGNYTLAGVKLYRNYDGAMSTYGDTNVRANTSDVANLPVYASQDASDPSRLHIIVINRSGSVQAANVTITGPYGFSTGRVWAFDSSTYNITERTAITSITGNAFTYNVPAYTAMHMVLVSNMLTPTFTQTLNPLWTKTFTPTASPTATITPASILLDDCEDGNNTNNWGGAWYNYVSNTSTILPSPYVMTAPGMTGSANYCMSMTGNIATGAYGGTGTNLNSGGTGVDLTGYTGIEFYAKGTGNYWFQLTQSAITGSYFGKNIAVSSTTAWTKFTVMFATDLTQRYGGPGTLTLNAIIALQWANNADGAMNLQVDDIRLIPAAAFTPTNTPVVTATRTPSRTITISPPATFTFTRTRTLTPTFTRTRTNTPANTSSFTRTVSPTASASPTPTYTRTRTNTPVNTPTFTRTWSPTASESPTPTYTRTRTNTPVNTPTFTRTGSPTASASPTPTYTRTRTNTPGNTSTFTRTVSPTTPATATPTYTRTRTNTPSPTVSGTWTPGFGTLTNTPTISQTRTYSASPTGTPSASASDTASVSQTPTYTRTRTVSVSPQNTNTRTPTYTRTPTRSATPASTAADTYTATRTATPVNTSTYTGTNTPVNTATRTSSATASVSPMNTYTGTPSATASVSPMNTYTGTPSATASVSPMNTYTGTPTNTAIPPSATSTGTNTHTPVPPTSTWTAGYGSPTNTPVVPTLSASATASVSPMNTYTGTPSATASVSPMNTYTGTPSATASVSPMNTYTGTPSATASVSPMNTYTGTPSATASVSPMNTYTGTPSATASVSPMNTYTGTPTRTATTGNTVTNTPVNTATPTFTRTRTATSSVTPSNTNTVTPTPTFTQTGTPTFTATLSATYTVTCTPTPTPTGTPTLTRTFTPTFTVTPTVTGTCTSLPTPTSTAISGETLEITNFVSYPNPYLRGTSGGLNFYFETNRPAGSYTLDIYTPAYRLVKRETGKNLTLFGECRINLPQRVVGNFSAGSYYCILKVNDGKSEAKSKPIVLIFLK